MKLFITFSLIFASTVMSSIAVSEEKPAEKPAEKKNTVYKYKEYEVIDLGSMEIKGQIIAPGDLTVNERERKVFKRSLLEKNNYDFENRREIENLR